MTNALPTTQEVSTAADITENDELYLYIKDLVDNVMFSAKEEEKRLHLKNTENDIKNDNHFNSPSVEINLFVNEKNEVNKLIEKDLSVDKKVSKIPYQSNIENISERESTPISSYGMQTPSDLNYCNTIISGNNSGQNKYKGNIEEQHLEQSEISRKRFSNSPKEKYICTDEMKLNIDNSIKDVTILPLESEGNNDHVGRQNCIYKRNDLQEVKNHQNCNGNRNLYKKINNEFVLPAGSLISQVASSDILIRDTEMELRKVHFLTSKASLQGNKTMYRLAYDENLTDESETEEMEIKTEHRKNSAVWPETHTNTQNESRRSEIIVHEGDSESDAGSEDVELLPHRYISEGVQKCDKHIYVNNLSLAVEMLRTRENLPYDEEFKRIVDEDTDKKNKCSRSKAFGPSTSVSLIEKVNKYIVGDHGLFSNKDDIQQLTDANNTPVGIDDIPNKECSSSTDADSEVQSAYASEKFGEEAKGAFAKDKVAVRSEQDRCNNEVFRKKNYQRLGVQAQNFTMYTPHSRIMNPCLCCVIM